MGGGASIAQWLALLLLNPGSTPNVAQKISGEKNVDVAEVHQRRCLEESGHWLENVDRNPLVLTSVKLILQKKIGGELSALDNKLNSFGRPSFSY